MGHRPKDAPCGLDAWKGLLGSRLLLSKARDHYSIAYASPRSEQVKPADQEPMIPTIIRINPTAIARRLL
jgi:hypothetical protein